MRFGLHLSISKGYQHAIEEARQLKCETIQIFTRSPRMWRTRNVVDAEASAFCASLVSARIHPLVVHTPYLPNLCTSDAALYKRSLDAFVEDISRAEQFCAAYLVIHPGSYSPDKTESEGYDNLVKALDSIFKPKSTVTVLLENMAGGGRRLGSSFEKLAWIMEKIKHPENFGICLDTCHAVGAGYDLSQKKGTDDLVKTIKQTVGLDRIKLVHLNDSKTPPGSHRDRHEHIGKGYIGEKGFRYFLTHPAFNSLPAILETPKNPPGSDEKNIAMARTLFGKK